MQSKDAFRIVATLDYVESIMKGTLPPDQKIVEIDRVLRQYKENSEK